jgi:hypothetical protein
MAADPSSCEVISLSFSETNLHLFLKQAMVADMLFVCPNQYNPRLHSSSIPLHYLRKRMITCSFISAALKFLHLYQLC